MSLAVWSVEAKRLSSQVQRVQTQVMDTDAVRAPTAFYKQSGLIQRSARTHVLIFVNKGERKRESIMKNTADFICHGVMMVATGAAMGIAATAAAQDHKIMRADLPVAVEQTVQKETAGAVIKGFATEMEQGKVTYEVLTILNGHTRDLSIAKNGTLLEIEEEVAMQTLPGSVQDALHKKLAGGVLTKVESLTKRGKLVAYEVSYTAAGKHREAQVGPAGERLLHQE